MKDKIEKSYELSCFQKNILDVIFSKNICVTDFYMADEDNDLILCLESEDNIIDMYIICENTDVYFSRIGKYDETLDELKKIDIFAI